MPPRPTGVRANPCSERGDRRHTLLTAQPNLGVVNNRRENYAYLARRFVGDPNSNRPPEVLSFSGLKEDEYVTFNFRSSKRPIKARTKITAAQ
ncbi:hypothetical protein AB870_24615 (plasmid) [Pandoraea faecigallinarum]|uniref:Uncharacterized protein n=1 Tax=Pandoraea faecigallinarum TaxID=656179 RepID=A0A0H3X340_9BURK|nr:hypothetical protein AB870_24615 [Pandoraea faecigallinarum]